MHLVPHRPRIEHTLNALELWSPSLVPFSRKTFMASIWFWEIELLRRNCKKDGCCRLSAMRQLYTCCTVKRCIAADMTGLNSHEWIDYDSSVDSLQLLPRNGEQHCHSFIAMRAEIH